MEEREYILGINLVKEISLKIFYDIFYYFETMENFYSCTINELQKYPFLSEKVINSLINHRNNGVLEKHLELLHNKGIEFITIIDKNYPIILKNIHLPPPALYYIGDLQSALSKNCISIVGSRKASYYGLKMSKKFGFELAKANITIVSGLARGIDTMAHMGAINANGMTIAVLGNGIDIIYPKENNNLYKDITEQGVIISEFPPGTPPLSYNFPQRNRIISGLSMGTVIIEASKKSGSLITAKYALEQGREVYALPGNISNGNSMGSNGLIREGAKIILETKDILEDIYPMFSTENKEEIKVILSKGEKEILNLIKLGYNDADKIYQKCTYDIPTINSILTTLEIKNIILIHKGNYFVK